MTSTYVEEEEELVELEEGLQQKKQSVADAELRKSMGREGTMQDISDDPEVDTLWSMIDGAAIYIPHFMTARTLRKRLPSGQRMFTSRRSQAPKYLLGNVLCWLHADHPRRPEWNQMGLAGKTCESAHLASPYSARIHMRHRHKDEWAAIESYQGEQRDDEWRKMQQQQLDATLALARGAAGVTTLSPLSQVVSATADPEMSKTTTTYTPGPAVTMAVPIQLTCGCGYVTKPDSKNPQTSLDTHQRMHCPLRQKEE